MERYKSKKGNDQKKAQSEINSHSKIFKLEKTKLTTTYTRETYLFFTSREQLFLERRPLSYTTRLTKYVYDNVTMVVTAKLFNIKT